MNENTEKLALPLNAYPGEPQTGSSCQQGIGLRDYFAGMALAGLAQNQEILLGNKELIEHFGTAGIDKLQANKAYRLADAMLSERSKQPNKQ